jgi:putative oxidoreductase
MDTSHNPLARWANLPMRLLVGCGFMAHGFAKLARGPDAFAAVLRALDVPAPQLMAWMTICFEVVGGLFIFLGAFVALFTVPLGVILAVAMFTVHLRYGFSSIKLVSVTAAGPRFGPPGYELDLLYLVCLVALSLGGSGPWSFDEFIQKRRRSQSSN